MTKPSIRLSSRRSVFLASLSIAALIAASAAQAGPAHSLDIPAGSLEGALVAVANQTHEQVFFTPDVVAGRRAPALHGEFTAEQALARLLADSGVKVSRAGPTMLVLTSKPQRPPARTEAAGGESARPFGDEAHGSAAPAPGAPLAAAPPATTVDELEITGSHIRGGGPGASPLVVMDRTDLDRLGRTTVADALGALPQNFGGQATEQSAATGTDRLNTNVAFGTSVNLRGLGNGATLVLINGRRLGGAGGKGDFTDVSTIPTVAVERVEVLLDGASALYGSDAVGGVVNIILRRDLDGGEVKVEGGRGVHGPGEAQVGLVFGRTWTGGSLLLAYEAYQRDALASSDRRFTQSADLRPLGGSDWRNTFSYPGNILRLDPTTLVNAPFYGIPAGQNGVGLRSGDLLAGVVNLSNPRANTDVLPGQRRNSLYAALRQDLGERVELSSDLVYGFRRAKARFAAPTALLSVSRANPFFVGPAGATSDQIQYSFAEDLPPPVSRATAETVQASAGARVDLFRDWRADGFLGFSQEIEEARNSGAVNSTLLAEALGNVADRATTAYSPVRDGFFNPFTGAPNNTPAVLAAIGSGFSNIRTRSQVSTANLQADGALFDLPGGPLKLALGGQVRRETFVRGGANYTSTVAPVALAATDADRTVAALFAELRAPLVGAANRRPGLERLELSAAVRWERYNDFGRTLNPKVGLSWSPVGDLALRATYGRSFRAPSLREVRDAPLNSPTLLPVGSGRVLSLLLTGGNPDLRPETADTWTVGADWRPAAWPGLRASATGFDIDYRNRIDRPVTSNLATALTDPSVATFVRRLDPNNAADLAAITALLADPATSTAQGAFPANTYGAIVDTRYVNTGRLHVRGLDLSGGYAFDLAGGDASLAANATYLLKYDQALTPTSPTLERVGRVGYPAKFRGRLTADWTRDALTLGVAVNRTSAFHDLFGVRVDGLTTADLQVRLAGAPGSRWAGAALSLNVRNLFDTAPPFYDNPAGFGFDGANADVIGRFVSLQLTKRW